MTATAPSDESTALLHQADLTIDPARFEVRRGEAIVPLTHVEFRLLLALVSADGRVLTRDQLLDVVYGQDDSEVLDRTIDVHIGRLRAAIEDDPKQPRRILTVRGAGYVFARKQDADDAAA